VVYPILVLQHQVATPVKSYFEKKRSIQELEQKLLDVQQERDTLLAQNIELQGTISFAQDTQELVEFKQGYNGTPAILSQVLVKNLSEQSQFFLIDKGAQSGVCKDMVVVYKDCLIGKVTDVYPHYSKVLLVSDQSCKVAAYCAQSKASGIYQGSNEKGGSLNHVSHLSSLEENDLILSSGDGLIFPRGFGLGKVKSFVTQGLFHEIAVEPLIDLRSINHCYIVQKGAQLCAPDKTESVLG
jgi:rod shape-determining protein MreC